MNRIPSGTDISRPMMSFFPLPGRERTVPEGMFERVFHNYCLQFRGCFLFGKVSLGKGTRDLTRNIEHGTEETIMKDGS